MTDSKTLKEEKLQEWLCVRCTHINSAPKRPRLTAVTASASANGVDKIGQLCGGCDIFIPAILCAVCDFEIVVTGDMLTTGWLVCDHCDPDINLSELLILDYDTTDVADAARKAALETSTKICALAESRMRKLRGDQAHQEKLQLESKKSKTESESTLSIVTPANFGGVIDIIELLKNSVSCSNKKVIK